MDLSKLPGKPGSRSGDATTGREGERVEGAGTAGAGAGAGGGGGRSRPEGEPHSIPYASAESATGLDPWIGGPEALLYAGIGLIVCFMVQNPFRLVLSLAGMAGAPPMGTPLNLGPGMVAYEKSVFLFHDAGPALLGVGLIMEAVALGALRREGLAWATVGWTMLSGVLSALAFLYLMYKGQGPQIFPLMAAIVAGYTSWSLSRRLQGR